MKCTHLAMFGLSCSLLASASASAQQLDEGSTGGMLQMNALMTSQQLRTAHFTHALGVWKAEISGYNLRGERTFSAQGTRKVVESEGAYFSTLRATTSDGRPLVERIEARYTSPVEAEDADPHTLEVKILEGSGPQFGGLEPLRFLTTATDYPTHLFTRSVKSQFETGRQSVEIILSAHERLNVSWTLLFGTLGDFVVTHLRRSNSCLDLQGSPVECAFVTRDTETAESLLYGSWAGGVMSFHANGELLDMGSVAWSGFQLPDDGDAYTFQETYVGQRSLTVTETKVTGSQQGGLALETAVVFMRGESPFPFINSRSTLLDKGTHLHLIAIEYAGEARLDLAGVAQFSQLSDARFRLQMAVDEERKPYLITISAERPVGLGGY